MATITATVDLTYHRVGVTLAGFALDGPITVERVVVATGARAPMRAVSAVSGGVAFGWDYEAPFGIPFRYEAYSGATLVASTATENQRTNLAVNPSGEGASGWNSNGAGWTPSWDATRFRSGTRSRKSVPTTTPGTDSTILSLYGVGHGAQIAVTPGDTITSSVHVTHSLPSACEGYAQISFYTSGGALLTSTYGTTIPVPSGAGWTRVQATATAPANAALMWTMVVVQRPGGALTQAGDSAWADDVLIESTASLLPYFDGSASSDPDRPSTAWTGAANDSTSTASMTRSTITSTDAMLRAPGLPSLDLVVEVVQAPASTRERPRVILRPLGRTSALVLSDTAKSAEFTLVVRTYGYQAADALVELFSGTPTALLIMPGAREDHRYVSIGGLVENPLVDYKAADGTDVNDPGAIAEWALPCVVTDSPVGGLYGDPTSSYDVVLATRATYSAVLTAKPTYLELLKGA